MILIDSNIFMYAAGCYHPNKEPSVAFLKNVAGGGIEVCVSVEILQEILHRYRSINRWKDGKNVYLQTRKIIPVVEPITDEILTEAFKILDRYPNIIARDGLHAATCFILNLEGICSFDEDFDTIEGLQRFTPDR